MYEKDVEIRFHDGLNRLVREDNVYLDRSVTYEYDNGGNVLNKKYYAYTTGTLGTILDTVNYTYDSTWKDKLTSYDGGDTITYDEIGNPLSYRGITMSWEKGRQLHSVSVDGDQTLYYYNADGLRTKKTFSLYNSLEYTYASGLLMSQTDGTNTLSFMYSPGGTALGFKYNGTKYFYLRNVQGDIVSIYDSTGTIVVNYTYDSWGKLLSTTGSLATTIGVINPLRYRGYYYDTETGLYYLQSRYYDPETGRFINADGIMGINPDMATYNLFAYCGNNPVNRVDTSGYSFWNLIGGIASVVGGFLELFIGALTIAVGIIALLPPEPTSKVLAVLGIVGGIFTYLHGIVGIIGGIADIAGYFEDKNNDTQLTLSSISPPKITVKISKTSIKPKDTVYKHNSNNKPKNKNTSYDCQDDKPTYSNLVFTPTGKLYSC